MNNEFLRELGIDPNKNLKELLNDLEEQQMECLERLDTVNNEERREELERKLEKIEKEIEDIKAQLKKVSTSIVLDLGETEQGAAEKKEAKKNSKVAEKAEAFRNEGLKKQKEKKVQQTQNNKLNQSNAKPASNKNTGTSAKPKNEYSIALRDYHNGNYTKAFPVMKKLSEQGDHNAQLILARMYEFGEGETQDDERAEFWYEKSAGDEYNVYPLGKLAYANFLAIHAKNERDPKFTKGINYLNELANSGNSDAIASLITLTKNNLGGDDLKTKVLDYCEASISKEHDGPMKNSVMETYVDLVKNGYGGSREKEKARDYCEKLATSVNDSFDQHKYRNLKKEFENSIRKIQEKEEKERREIAKATREATKQKKKDKRTNIWMIIAFLLIALGIKMFLGSIEGSGSSASIGNSVYIFLPFFGHMICSSYGKRPYTELADILRGIIKYLHWIVLIGTIVIGIQNDIKFFTVILMPIAGWYPFELAGKLIGFIISKFRK